MFAKKFSILQGTLPIDIVTKRTGEDCPLIDRIARVCAALYNVTQLCPSTKKRSDQLLPRSRNHVVLFSFLHGYHWTIAIQVVHIIEATCTASDISCGDREQSHLFTEL